MSAKTFIKDLQDYFVDLELTDYDKKRIEQMFLNNASVVVKQVPVDRIVYRTQRDPIIIHREKNVYVDSNTGKFINFRSVAIPQANNEEVEKIIDNVCQIFKVDKSLVLSNCREQHTIYPRFFICHYLRQIGLSLVMISRYMNRNHSTVIRAICESEKYLSLNFQPYTKIWEAFNEQLKNKEVTN
jgi:hypothetical protein